MQKGPKTLALCQKEKGPQYYIKKEEKTVIDLPKTSKKEKTLCLTHKKTQFCVEKKKVPNVFTLDC